MPSVSTLTTDAPVLLVQLSDSHLFADADGSLLGLKTAQSLQQVIALVRAEQPSIDVLLATGDLAQDGSVAAYQQFRQATQPLAAVARWLPGNHDNVQHMAAAAVQSRLMEPRVDIGNWRITLLHSNVANKSHGYLEDNQLQLLAQSLSEAPDRHHVVCLHHHPVADQQRVLHRSGRDHEHLREEQPQQGGRDQGPDHDDGELLGPRPRDPAL